MIKEFLLRWLLRDKALKAQREAMVKKIKSLKYELNNYNGSMMYTREGDARGLLWGSGYNEALDDIINFLEKK